MLTCNNVSFLMTLTVVVIVTIFYNVTTMLQINLLCGDFVTSCCKLRWGRNAFNHGWSASFCKHSPWSSFSERGVSWNFVLKVTQGGLQTSKEGLTGSQNINQKKEGGWCKVMDIVFVSELKPAHKCIKPSDWRTERLVLIERCSFTQWPD